MELNILGSNSLGNCYVLQNDSEALIIECGIEVSDVLKTVNYNSHKIVGAIVSHRHNDHAGYVKKFIDYGIQVIALADVFSSKNLTGNMLCKEIIPNKRYKIGNFIVQPFSVNHDAPCVGYLITHPEIGKLVFATDTTDVPYKFSKLNHIMIEANFYRPIVVQKIVDGDEHATRSYPRLCRSHMEFEETKRFLSYQDLSSVQEIILIHLSDGNSDEAMMKREVEQLTGVLTYTADRGQTISLNY